MKVSFHVGRVIVPGTPGEWVFPDHSVDVAVENEADIPEAAERVAQSETERLGTPQRAYAWREVRRFGRLGPTHIL